MKRSFLAAVVSAAFLISGCGSLLRNENVAKDFDCPVQQGYGCKSIADMRNMIVQGGKPTAVYYNTSAPSVSVSGVPKWKSDVVLKVHLGTYVDANGDYHEAGVMYVVARHGGWDVQ